MAVNEKEVVDIEINLLITAINDGFGFDLSHYKKASLKRRILSAMEKYQLKYVSEIIPHLLHQESFFKKLICDLSVPVTEMYRDPEFFLSVREEIIPVLKTYPVIKIWHAGCASGEEVYSMAILLHEEGLYDRCHIYATDINDISLAQAKDGIYRYEDIKKYSSQYKKSGGTATLENYFHLTFENAVINNFLKKNIIFANHNLSTDEPFSKINLILCRNVFIYFDRFLQDKVTRLFLDSLCLGGFLCLGTKEYLKYSTYDDQFEHFKEKENIYRKLYPS